LGEDLSLLQRNRESAKNSITNFRFKRNHFFGGVASFEFLSFCRPVRAVLFWVERKKKGFLFLLTAQNFRRLAMATLIDKQDVEVVEEETVAQKTRPDDEETVTMVHPAYFDCMPCLDEE
jgi:hypothetical protein